MTVSLVRPLLPANPIGRRLLNSLIEYWPLDEASGNRRGLHNGLTLTDTNTVTGNPGPSSKLPTASECLRANSETLVRAGDDVLLSMGDIACTFSIWVYVNAKFAGDWQVFLGKNKAFNDDREYVLWLDDTDRFALNVGNDATNTAGGNVADTALGSPALSTWYLLFGWHDPIANTISIQVNNLASASASYSNGVYDGGIGFAIGKQNGATTFYTSSRLAGAAIWKRLLTAQERAWLFNNGVGRSFAEGRGFY